MAAPKLPPKLAGLNDEINVAHEAWLWLKVNLAFLTGAIAVTLAGILLARLLSRWADRALTSNSRIEPTVAKFLSNLIRYALWVVVAVTVLTQFGVQTTSIIAALGGLALAVGLALQGTLSNVAAGVMILIQRPFQVGEFITAGTVSGTVQGIGLFTTELLQLDGLYVMVPNNELWNKAVVNASRMPKRRFELVVPIGYEDDLAAAKEAHASADTIEEEYRRQSESARAEAQQAVQQAKAKAARDAEKRLAKIDTDLNAKMASAEVAIAEARSSAMAEIASVASEAARDLVAKVSGAKVTAADADKAVKAVLHG